MAAPITARIAESLSLPTYGYENALRYTDKTKMRKVFKEAGLPVPKYFSVDTIEPALKNASMTGYPFVIKPADSFSSRGVFIIHNENELRNMFQTSLQFSRCHKVIQEEYLAGSQYFCQGYIDNYKLRVYAFSDRYYFKLPNAAIPYTNAFPARIDETLRNRMTEYFQKIVDFTRPRFGQVWVEWIYNEQTDTLYPVEMAIRGAGAHVTTDLIPYAYGIDSQPYLVRACTGDFSKSFDDEKIVPKAAAFYCFLLPEGKVIHVSGLDKIESIKGVKKSYVQEIHEGDITEPPVDKSSRYGPIIVTGNTRDDIDRSWEELKRTVRIEVETSSGIKGAIWE